MKMRRGISLIVLVITIIIIIILAGAVILNLADNNPIENASEAQILSDLDTFNSDLTLQIGNKYLEPNGSMLKTEDFDSDESRDGWKLLDLVPSMKGTGYEEYLAVVDSKLVLKEGTEIDEVTKEIIEEKLGEAIITPEMIKANVQKYIGKEVTYAGDNQPEGTTWRIFNVTENGTIQLITDSYVDLTYKGTTPAPNIVINGYNLSSADNRDTLINYLKDSSNWSEYAVVGKTTAKGAATIEEFCSSYKLKYPDKYVVVKYVTAGEKYDGSNVASADGYVVKLSTEENTAYTFQKTLGTNDDLYIKTERNYGSNIVNALRLASASANNEKHIISIDHADFINSNHCVYNEMGVCPIVSLSSNASIVEDDGKLVVK